MEVRRHASWGIVATVFMLTLVGLLFDISLGQVLVSWAAFLSAAALIVGALNLFITHLRRTGSGNVYSTILVLSMVLVWLAPILDVVVDDWATTMFTWIQVPLEAALGSLLIFFLLFAGMRLTQRKKGRIWALLFVIGAILVLSSTVGWPGSIDGAVQGLAQVFQDAIVSAGVKGILIGVALGTITMSLRILSGAERPYDK